MRAATPEARRGRKARAGLSGPRLPCMNLNGSRGQPSLVNHSTGKTRPGPTMMGPVTTGPVTMGPGRVTTGPGMVEMEPPTTHFMVSADSLMATLRGLFMVLLLDGSSFTACCVLHLARPLDGR